MASEDFSSNFVLLEHIISWTYLINIYAKLKYKNDAFYIILTFKNYM